MKERERSRDKKHSRHDHNYRPREHHQRIERPKFRGDVRELSKPEILLEVNRSEVCPFLARIYYAINNSNTYEKEADLPKDRQLILYLWMNSTLKQITELLRAHLPVIRTKQRFVFSRVSMENDKLVKTEIGTVMVHKKGMDKQENRLDQHKFSIGDYIDVSINYK